MYDRVVQWLAQPITAAVALVCAAVFHQNISHGAAATAGVYIASHIVGLVVHARWLGNVPRWWQHIENVGQTLSGPGWSAPEIPAETSKTDPQFGESVPDKAGEVEP